MNSQFYPYQGRRIFAVAAARWIFRHLKTQLTPRWNRREFSVPSPPKRSLSVFEDIEIGRSKTECYRERAETKNLLHQVKDTQETIVLPDKPL